MTLGTKRLKLGHRTSGCNVFCRYGEAAVDVERHNDMLEIQEEIWDMDRQVRQLGGWREGGRRLAEPFDFVLCFNLVVLVAVTPSSKEGLGTTNLYTTEVIIEYRFGD